MVLSQHTKDGKDCVVPTLNGAGKPEQDDAHWNETSDHYVLLTFKQANFAFDQGVHYFLPNKFGRYFRATQTCQFHLR